MHVTLSSVARPGGPNEDFAVSSSECVVVLDGAGMPKGLPTGCIHGVAWFAQRLGNALFREATETRRDLADCLATAIQRTADLHRGTCDVDSPFSPSAMVAALRVQEEEEAEWLVLGDVVLVLDDGREPAVITDQRLAEVASGERAALRTAEPGSDGELRTHTKLVQAERAMRNRPGGFWVAAADPEAAAEAITGSTPLGDLRRVALLSDGAARFVDTFALGDWSTCLGTLQQHGTAALIGQVRDAEFSDPARGRWPRSKMHDDATVIFARF
ncbi:protein phosphatase 2C domain-containing protein [Streptomyces sp. NPDC048629]|uniref:protein phosphatase 2C domain-containing protein n=1 Tax=Streptomyces sp. NPDC048629 TaxID=3154824 RepID=UPI00343DE79C